MAITRACIQRELSEFFVSLFNGQSFALTGQPVVSKRDGELGNVKYKDCSVCNWIRETTVTSQMRIQEKAIWKKFVFGFYSIKNQKLIFFKKYFRSFFLSVWGIKWVHNLKFFIYLCGYALKTVSRDKRLKPLTTDIELLQTSRKLKTIQILSFTKIRANMWLRQR